MKKITAAFLVLAMAVALAGCSDKNDSDISGSDIVKVELGEEMQISKSDSQNLLGKLASLKGYEIRFRYFAEDSEADTIGGATIGQTRTAWWYLDDSGVGTAYFNKDDAYYVYTYTDGAWEYVSSATGSAFSDSALGMQEASAAYLYLANSYSGQCKKEGEGTVAGRACDIFKYDLSTPEFSGFYRFSIDKEYGITLKMDIVASGENAQSVSYEVLSFETGIKTPAFPDPSTITALDYESGEWPVSVFTEQVPRPEYGKINVAGITNDSLFCVIEELSSEGAEDYIELLQSSDWGFKGELFDYSGYLTFDGKNTKTGYSVQITYWDGTLSMSVEKTAK